MPFVSLAAPVSAYGSSYRAAGPSLLETLDASGERGRSLAELGIGTNPAATLTGNVLDDKQVIGTMHLAFGTSAGIGGVNVARVHIEARGGTAWTDS